MAKTAAENQPAPQTETDLINQALNTKGISINALADQTGIPFSTLRRSLKGDRALNLLELRKIAAALNVSPAALLPADLTQDAA